MTPISDDEQHRRGCACHRQWSALRITYKLKTKHSGGPITDTIPSSMALMA